MRLKPYIWQLEHEGQDSYLIEWIGENARFGLWLTQVEPSWTLATRPPLGHILKGGCIARPFAWVLRRMLAWAIG